MFRALIGPIFWTIVFGLASALALYIYFKDGASLEGFLKLLLLIEGVACFWVATKMFRTILIRFDNRAYIRAATKLKMALRHLNINPFVHQGRPIPVDDVLTIVCDEDDNYRFRYHMSGVGVIVYQLDDLDRGGFVFTAEEGVTRPVEVEAVEEITQRIYQVIEERRLYELFEQYSHS